MAQLPPRTPWNLLQVFAAVMETGSFTKAAELLRVSQPTVSRSIGSLEETLGVSLFIRTARGLSSTPTSLELLDYVRKMEDAADGLLRTASGQTTNLSGTVRISSSESLAMTILPPLLTQFSREEAEIDIEVVVSNTADNLLKREADIALRNFAPQQKDLVAKKIGTILLGMFASNDYLARMDTEPTPATLHLFDLIGADSTDRILRRLKELGVPITRENFRMRSDSEALQWEMIRNGAGIGFAPFLWATGRSDIVELSDETTRPTTELWLVCHEELRTSPKLRRVFDFLAEGLKRAINDHNPKSSER